MEGIPTQTWMPVISTLRLKSSYAPCVNNHLLQFCLQFRNEQYLEEQSEGYYKSCVI